MELDPATASNNFLFGLSRIKCNGARIQVGDRDFTSASEALEAYLDQYAGITSKSNCSYRQNVSDLLDPKSALHMTAERSLQTGIRHTEAELKLANARDAISDSYDRMKKNLALRAEERAKKKTYVEEALNRSGDLLHRIANDEPSPTYPSDIDSLNTDMLMGMNPSAEYPKDLPEVNERRNRHVYSYKTPRYRSKTVTGAQIGKDVLDLEPNMVAGNTRPSKPPNSFRNSQPRERSRSVSPSSFRHEERLLSNPARRNRNVSRDDFGLNTSGNKTPSWVEALDISNPSETFWSKRDLVSGRLPPSWVNGLDKSDITSLTSDVPQKKVGFADLAPEVAFNKSRDFQGPELSFNDLLSKSPGKSSLKSPKSQRKYDKYDLTSKLPQEVLNAGNQSATSSDILDKYLDESAKGDNSYNMSRPPRCSSLDTEALLAGISAPNKSDITGASPITCLDKSPPRTPRKSRPMSPDTDVVLEGDRSWEKPITTFKSPVFIDDQAISDPRHAAVSEQELATLTGSPQPGSLEALKNMLFKLQTEAAAHAAGNPVNLDTIKSNGEGTTPLEEEVPALKGYNWQEEPGGQSLERALHHLGRLKTLVNNDKERILRSRSPSPGPMRSKSYSPARSKPLLGL